MTKSVSVPHLQLVQLPKGRDEEPHLRYNAADSTSRGVMKGWKSGAGSWFDAWLTSAAAQV